MRQPAISRYGANTPALLRWFVAYNRDRFDRQQVKPFNFLLALSLSAMGETSEGRSAAEHKSGRPKREKPAKPIAPFSHDPMEAAVHAFDRETGKPVSREVLKTCAEALVAARRIGVDPSNLRRKML